MKLLVIDNPTDPLQSKVHIEMTVTEAVHLAAYANMGALGKETSQLIGVMNVIDHSKVAERFDLAYEAVIKASPATIVIRDFNKAVMVEVV